MTPAPVKQKKLRKTGVKRGKAIEIVGPDGKRQKIVEDKAAEETPANGQHARGAVQRRILRRTIQNQGHKRRLPHLTRPDCNASLRRIATTGVLTLFNAVKRFHEMAPKEDIQSEIKALTAKPAKGQSAAPKVEEIKKSEFLEMLRRGTAAKAHAKVTAEDTAKDAAPRATAAAPSRPSFAFGLARRGGR